MADSSRHTAVVLFCDCHNFSRLMLDLSDSVFEFMESFYRECGECIVTGGGRIVKYIGDAILAVFSDGAVEEAVEAGRCMRSRYASLLQSFGTDVDSEMEVGIASGEVWDGTVGHPSLRSYDVFGECVNEAAVIGHHRGIALTDEARKLLLPETKVRAIAPYAVKWREEPLHVWEIVGP